VQIGLLRRGLGAQRGAHVHPHATRRAQQHLRERPVLATGNRDPLDLGFDVVIGSRNIPGGNVEGWGAGRHFISKGGSLYSRTILGLPIRDLTSGYKAYTRRALQAVALEEIDSNGYSFQIEMTYRALRRGMSVKEVPIVFVDRTQGKSKMSRKVFLEAVGMVWRLRFDALRGRL